MDRRRLEVRVLELAARVRSGGRVEDDLVECKAAWPAPERAARRLAAHANAARGAEILWIIGLDEDNGSVNTLDHTEPADWWAQMERQFADGVAPDLQHLNVVTEHGPVVALNFRTDRSPYLINVVDARGVDREIPWRSGTRTRTAKRSEVLSLLVDAMTPPSIELFQLELTATLLNEMAPDRYGQSGRDPSVRLDLQGRAYFEPAAASRAPVMLPKHKWKAQVVVGRLRPASAELSFAPHMVRSRETRSGWAAEESFPAGAVVRQSGIYLSGPDTLQIRAHASLDVEQRHAVRSSPFVDLQVELPASGSPRATTTRLKLEWQPTIGIRSTYPSAEVLAVWKLVSSSLAPGD